MQRRLVLEFLMIWMVLSLQSFDADFVTAVNPETVEMKVETEELFPRIQGVTFESTPVANQA